ncbi:hypothetical protein GCM10010493_79000 [Streptomyces lavendulae subsp. grasserius]
MNRNGGRRAYRAALAEQRAWDNARRPQDCRLARHPQLRHLVAGKLAEDWSPEQISGWLVAEFPDDESLRISAETIYRSLLLQARGVLARELIGRLRCRRAMRRSKEATKSGQGRGSITDAVSITERPAEVEGREVPGHERHSRYVMLVKVDGEPPRVEWRFDFMKGSSHGVTFLLSA